MFGNVVRHAQFFADRVRGNSQARASDLDDAEEVIRLEPIGKRLPEKRGLSTSNITANLTNRLELLIGQQNASGQPVNEFTSLSVPAVIACASLLADMVAKLPIELLQRTKTGPRAITRHPAIRVLNRPSDLHTGYELRQLMMIGKALGGNGYARIFRDEMYRPIAIEWMPPIHVAPRIIERPNGNSFVSYDYRGTALTRGDVAHIKWYSRDGVIGLSPITLLRESIGTSMAQTQAAGKLMKDGAYFPGYLISQQTLPPDKIRDAREEWDRNYAGARNAGRVPILNGTFDFKQTAGMSMTDAQFIESRRFELQEIARHYRIPPFLIGDSTASTTWGTGIEQQTLGFLNFCLDPHLTAFEQALEATLLTADEIAAGYYFRFDRDELASVSRQDTANYFQTMRSIGVYSVNDIRAKLDEPLIDAADGGDDYSLPFNNTGGAAQSKAATTPQPAPDQQPA